MRKIILLTVVCACFCAGASCSVSCDGSSIPWPSVGTELDRATCTLRIAENATGGTATATAQITSSTGWPVELGEGQSVQVNNQPMTATGGEYAVTIQVTGTYTVTVTEPTRGVQTTSQTAPPDFQITSPADGGPASLSGFTVSYTNPDASLQVSIVLTQTLFGHENHLAVGPFTDTGSKSFTVQDLDLAGFRQGADLSIAVTKISRRDGINGFAAGQLSVERARSVKAKPQP